MHRHIKETDCSLAIVGGPAAACCHGAAFRAYHHTGPTYIAKACYTAVGNIASTVNIGRQAGRMSGQLL